MPPPANCAAAIARPPSRWRRHWLPPAPRACRPKHCVPAAVCPSRTAASEFDGPAGDLLPVQTRRHRRSLRDRGRDNTRLPLRLGRQVRGVDSAHRQQRVTPDGLQRGGIRRVVLRFRAGHRSRRGIGLVHLPDGLIFGFDIGEFIQGTLLRVVTLLRVIVIVMPSAVIGVKDAARRIDHLVGAVQVVPRSTEPSGSTQRSGRGPRYRRRDRNFARRRHNERTAGIWGWRRRDIWRRRHLRRRTGCGQQNDGEREAAKTVATKKCGMHGADLRDRGCPPLLT